MSRNDEKKVCWLYGEFVIMPREVDHKRGKGCFKKGEKTWSEHSWLL
jgi:hypothetical protein